MLTLYINCGDVKNIDIVIKSLILNFELQYQMQLEASDQEYYEYTENFWCKSEIHKVKENIYL